MPEDNKPKATLIKQSRSAEMQAPVSQQPQQKPLEKKRVVIVKKKPVVVVKANVPADEPKEEKPQPQAAPQKDQEKTEVQVKAPEVKKAEQEKPQIKKVVKKTSNVNTTISNGPVIISGANLPPINFGTPKRPSGSGPVGSVGGVVYGADGKRIPQNRNRQGQPNSGVYTPKSSQGRRAPFGKDRPNDFGGQRPNNGGFRGGNAGGNRGAKPGFSQPMGNDSGKNKRVFSKDKGRDRRHEIQDDELELKQFGKKKSATPVAVVAKNIDIMPNVTVSDLAKKMNIKASEIISKLFSMGMMVSINQSIDSDTATIIAEEYGCQVHIIDLYEETVIEKEEDKEEDLKPRAPIVTVMGHVDHGKTKLLDAIRSTNVVAGEFGGITQHIGAYKVSIPDKGDVVFLDTPGHAAFTLMRARGAQVTDIVVLVVAANDGVMPQTIEAIDHAKAAGVPIIVAINKIDLPEAKPERVMQQLSDYGLMPEEWGGQTLFCQISAKQRIGIDNLLDTILLQAEMMDLKANPDCRAEGRVLEARIDQGRGIVASVIVERGTLKQGDYYVAGIYPGRVRAMFNDKGKKVKTAGPSTPVEVIGLSAVPSAGDPFQVCEDEKQSRIIGTKRQELERQNQASRFKKVTLENMFDVMHEGDVQELNLVIKGDVQGSVEALKMALEKLSTPEIRVSVIRAAAGAIIEDDINLASASENPALVIGFNVRPTPKAQSRADEEKIDIRKYNIIYNVVDDVKAAMEGMLSPERTELDVGTAVVRQVFKVPKVGLIAGCFITSGSVKRNNFCRVVRDNIQLSKELLKISSLKRFKDDAREVTEGFECGIGIENFQDLREGDIIEFVEIQETARKLDNVWERI
ncbi:MAG: translation initiation factor IF-2 [Sphaerochaetaceae bacterium]|nr:translation initiation factor IF-2 [Sphaerochaetaceae bacterium]